MSTGFTTATGLTLPRLGQGTWEKGLSAATRRDEVRALQLGLDLGMTLIDTAEMYADGGAEAVVGEAIRGRRAVVCLVSKVLPQNASYQGTLAACERSLSRLATDHLDLYLLHWEGPHPLAETLRAFAALQAAGKIRGFGLSNFDHDQMQHPGLAANQVLYNLTRRGIERRLLPECARRGIAVMAYSPLEQGRLRTGGALGRLAARHGRSAAQIALAWTLRHPHVVAIPKAGTAAHVRENAAVAAIRLDAADLRELDAEYPAPAHDVPLETL